MAGKRAPRGYDASKYPPFAVTADLVIFTVIGGRLHVALIERSDDPYAGSDALPGGFVDDETLRAAAVRELAEETGLDMGDGVHLEQLATYGDPGRDPRMRVVSVAWVALVPYPGDLRAGSDARRAEWTDIDTAMAGGLAFDHDQILTEGVERVRAKLEYTTLATSFVGDTFTLGELRAVYEAVWGVALHHSNFARKVLATDGFVVDTGERRTGLPGRASRLYRRGAGTTLMPPIMRPGTRNS